MERSLAMQRIQRQNDILQQFHMKLRADTDPDPVTNYLYEAKINGLEKEQPHLACILLKEG